jgi:hypothetical protein
MALSTSALGVGRIADRERADRRRERVDGFGVGRALHEHTRLVDAGLSAVAG